ncbi:MAG: HAMP domain-containing histidine kinase [Lachnospiraceae bacterium]|nr:HAMP domain-containing histidine kinase [Lachnospiraceae bacterium]
MKTNIKQELRTMWLAAVALFISIAFTVTIAFLFFFRSISLTAEQVRAAAPMTFGIILIITALFVAGYAVIRYITVIRPLGKINATLERVSAGDFSERLTEDGTYGNFAPLVKNINRMTGELETSALMKTDFISNVSHELKTPLAIINNYGTLLELDTITDEDRKEYAKSVTSASRRMSELISNILRMNRLENHPLEARREAFDLSAQLEECLLQYESVWEEKKIRLDLDIADEVEIESDAELLGLVWNNLLSNAFKFTETEGVVGVSLMADEQSVTVQVKDTGCGMDAETGKHIFDKFYQGDTSHAAQGNGLGLALVRRVIDLVDGEISVSSVLGEGTSFIVKIKK